MNVNALAIVLFGFCVNGYIALQTAKAGLNESDLEKFFQGGMVFIFNLLFVLVLGVSWVIAHGVN